MYMDWQLTTWESFVRDLKIRFKPPETQHSPSQVSLTPSSECQTEYKSEDTQDSIGEEVVLTKDESDSELEVTIEAIPTVPSIVILTEVVVLQGYANPVFIASSGVLFMDLYCCIPSVCQNVSMDCFSSFTLRMGSINYIRAPILKVRSAKLPAKPPEIIHSLHVDDLRALVVNMNDYYEEESSLLSFSDLWKCKRGVHKFLKVMAVDGNFLSKPVIKALRLSFPLCGIRPYDAPNSWLDVDVSDVCRNFLEANKRDVQDGTSRQIIPCFQPQDFSIGVILKLTGCVSVNVLQNANLDQADEVFDAISRCFSFVFMRFMAEALLLPLEMPSLAELCNWHIESAEKCKLLSTYIELNVGELIVYHVQQTF
ncbi:hypothetical protein QQ045_021382 [Rhodiola kirilowii]